MDPQSPVICPYCNAIVPPVQENRFVCTRCGEAFAYDRGQYRAVAPPLTEAFKPVPDSNANRKMALAIVVAMLAIAAFGLMFALRTYPERKKRHPPGAEALLKAKSHRPAELPALGFLPLETNVVAAIHVAQLVETAEGKKLLEPPAPVGVDWLRRNLDKWTGIPLEGVDHLVVGTQIKDRLPQITIVVQTRGTYDPKVVGMKHSTALQFHKKPLFPFKVEPWGDGLLWCPTNDILVFAIRLDAIKMEDMATIPVRPLNRLESFPAPLREAIQKRLPQASSLWSAGHLEQADILQSLAAFVPQAKGPAEFVSSVRTFALGLEFDKEVTLQGAVAFTNAKKAEQVEGMIQKRWVADWKELKIVELEDRWLGIQVRASVERLRQIVGDATEGWLSARKK